VVERRSTENGPLVRQGKPGTSQAQRPWEKMKRSLRKHIKTGCLVDDAKANHYKVMSHSSTGKVLLAVSRGSTGNESFHKVLNNAIGVNSDHKTAATHATCASFRITIKSLRDRGLVSDGKHWFVWKTKARSDLESKLYKTKRARFTLPPFGGLRIPVPWSDAAPLRPTSGLQLGTYSAHDFLSPVLTCLQLKWRR